MPYWSHFEQSFIAFNLLIFSLQIYFKYQGIFYSTVSSSKLNNGNYFSSYFLQVPIDQTLQARAVRVGSTNTSILLLEHSSKTRQVSRHCLRGETIINAMESQFRINDTYQHCFLPFQVRPDPKLSDIVAIALIFIDLSACFDRFRNCTSNQQF